jgi:hypothetical protein
MEITMSYMYKIIPFYKWLGVEDVCVIGGEGRKGF